MTRRIWGRNPRGKVVAVEIGTTDDEVTIRTPDGEAVKLPPEKAHKMREVLAWAVVHVLRGKKW